MNRPKTYTAAAILQFCISLVAVILSFPSLMPGSTLAEGIPYPVVLASALAGAIGLVSAYGVWKCQRWGVILTIVLRGVDGLLALPGVLYAPTPAAHFMATTGVIISAIIIVLLLWPTPRTATA